MKLERDDANPQWIATQGMWYGLGKTRPAAVLDCIVTCVEALGLGLDTAKATLRYELGRWWADVFRTEDRVYYDDELLADIEAAKLGAPLTIEDVFGDE